MNLSVKYLLLEDRGKKHLVRPGESLGTDRGVFEIPQQIRDGMAIRSHLDHHACLLVPDVRSYVEAMARPTRILHTEDIGFVLGIAGLREGQTVVEAGTGSGCSAMYFSQAVGPGGRVISFERREDIHAIAQDNVRGFGCDNIELVRGDIAEGLGDLRCDVLFLDLARPRRYIELAADSVKPGGHAIIYVPFLEDGTDTFRGLTDLGFLEVRLTEIHRREFEVVAGGTRPRTAQTVHTGYILTARAPPTGDVPAD
jgi:tRNA (adenine57-N1/adenine58-N1)-methyltransferase